ncbi:hypothetical protein EDD18DRAFT_1125991 [Armillaria luteobubalina]|uniref:Uncharacterized protein n=1 Tax=Armillaria luteobubalina TaxID=153913 RepID=A0AA39QN52_9AGAR|nr:hypothetical protein EDD18DRAFT_1125991 [Armillaria luteobubalina]
MTKRSPAPEFQKPPPAKHLKLPVLPKGDLATLTSNMRGIFLTYPLGSPLSNTSDALILVSTFWFNLHTQLGIINPEFQKRMKDVSDIDWPHLLQSTESGLIKILARLAGELPTERTWEPLLNCSILHKSTQLLRLPPTPEIHLSTSSCLQAQVTERSWSSTFQGRAVKALEAHVQHYLVAGKIPNQHYVPFTSIIQSSGMGKSRLIDEFSKTYFVIPINLRDASSSGFPPRDQAVYDYLNEAKTENGSLQRICRFLIALFRHTEGIVNSEEICSRMNESQMLAPAFRNYMTKGQDMFTTSKLRTTFYQQVVKAATEDNSTFDGDNGRSLKFGYEELLDAYQRLQDTIYMETKLVVEQKWRPMEERLNMPRIYILWDEAHCLTKPFDSNTGVQSIFSVLQHVLSMLREKALFSFFLSTTGKISQSPTARPVDPAARLYEGTLSLIPPFTDLGFDHFMAGYHLGSADAITLSDVTKVKHIVRMGRPLWGGRYEYGSTQVQDNITEFAQMKLLPSQRSPRQSPLDDTELFVCLAQRLALDINSTSYAALVQEKNLVQNYMRVCLKIGVGFKDLLTTSSSEPILSEACSLITRGYDDFDMPLALKILEGFSINQCDRGELLVLAFFTMARDAAIPSVLSYPWTKELPITLVLDLFSSLFTDDTFTRISSAFPSRILKGHLPLQFNVAFANAKVSFNHVIKIHQWKLLNRHLLPGFIARAAAILCANNQSGVDMVYPYLYYDDMLCVWNVGFILVQVKNDPSYTNEPMAKLFDLMDPFALGLFEKDQPTVPIIRMVFALAAPKASVTQVRYGQDTKDTCPVEDQFTSYDFWCAGISPACLKPVVAASKETWKALLHASYGWKKIYDVSWNPDGQACRR